MPPIDAIQRAIWFGFYQPFAALETASPTLAANFLTRISRPLQGDDEIPALLGTLSEALPVIRTFEEGLREAHGALTVSEVSNPLLRLEGDARLVVHLPRGRPVMTYLARLMTVMGGVARPPEGISRAPFQASGWNLALGMSFLFQGVLEISRRGLQIPIPDREVGILGATDLALFDVFRQRGIDGVMEVYPTLITPEEDLSEGGTDRSDWSPPRRGERPDLPTTFLDERADQVRSWGGGLLLRQAGASTRRRRRQGGGGLQRVLSRIIDTDADLSWFPKAMRRFAPRLASRLLPLIEEGEVGLRVVTTPGDPVSLAMPFASLFGLPTAEKSVIEVRRGVTVGEALVDFVGEVARAAIPEDLYRRARLHPSLAGTGQETPMVARYLDYRYRCRGAWSVSAMAEFVREAAAPEAGLQLGLVNQRMADLLRRLGLDVLIERYGQFLPPDAYQQELDRSARYAGDLVRAGGLESLIMFTSGEAVSEGELIGAEPESPEAARLREESRQRQQEARERRRRAREAAGEVRRREEEAREATRRAEQARLAEEERRRAAQEEERRRERLREEERLREVEALRQEEAERRATWSVLVHRQGVLKNLMNRLESAILELIAEGRLPWDVIGQDEISFVFQGTERSLRMRPSLESAAEAILEDYRRAAERPLSERDATGELAERMLALCDLTRSYLSWLSSPPQAGEGARN